MPEPVKPKVPSTEPIIELVETANMAYVVLAFVAGVAIMAAIVYMIGTQHAQEESNDG